MEDKDVDTEIYAELWRDGFYKRGQRIIVKKDKKNGEITVDNKKVTVKSYDKTCNILRLQEYHSDGYWVINEKTSGKDPGKIFEQLQPQA